MKRVAGVLDHFSSLDGRLMHLSRQEIVEFKNRSRKNPIIGADHCEWRMKKIVYGRPFSKELRVKAYDKVPSGLLATGRLQCRNNHFLGRARQNRASNNNQVK